MKVSALIYSLLSIMCFYGLFFYPQLAIFLLLFSPYFLLVYLEHIDRSKLSDIVSGVVYLGLLVALTVPSISYLLFVIIPIFILIYIRDKLTTQSYLAPMLSPMPFFILISLLLIFSPEFEKFVTGRIVEFITELVKPFENSVEKFNNNLGILTYFIADKEKSAKYIVNLLPSIFYSLISIVIFITDRLTSLRNETVEEYSKRDYRLPDKFVWLLIVGGFLILIPVENIKFLSINILIICGLLYFFQGIQMVSIFFDRINISGIFRGFIYAFLFTEPPIMMMLSLLGLFSIWYRPKWSIRDVNKDSKKI